jgi:hypothetical protein
MDKSKAYIRMCDAAEEIQLRWRREHGDFYADVEGRVSCWVSRDPQPLRFRGGFGICVRNRIIHLSRYVWLPRQNQLIEMAQLPGRRYESIVQDFFDWTKQPYETLSEVPGRCFPSMEKIWLAFVMQQKYNKQWDGSTWIRCLQPA